MTHHASKSNGGVTTASDTETIGRLRAALAGELIAEGDPGYEAARAVWNGMVDRRPALIARVASDDDVIHAVRYARETGLLVSVRGGGHHIAGNALCDGGIVIDQSRRRAITVDPQARRATVEAGALLSDVDAATQAHGLAVPLGINSTTGIAGLTLGGGFGWLSRSYGLTVDNLTAAEVVTAEGALVRASEAEHPDLFWAIRGGGGNFGVVTRFEFRLHPVGPNLLSGLVVYPIAQARSVLERYRAFTEKAPDELTVWAVLRKAPPLPFLPADAHGTPVLVLAFLYAGAPAAGEALVEPLHRFGTPVGAHAGVQPYAAWQQAFDPLLTAGARNYWKSHNLTGLSDGLLDTLVDAAGRLPSAQCEIFVAALGGATAAPKPDATAYAHRDARYVVNVHGRWEDRADDERGIAWARAFHRAAAPFATGGTYLNFMTEDEDDRVKAAYGSNLERLARVKHAYDPTNLFRVNQNIVPA
ncbi:MAG: FAD-binding oxidoreductase [Hyphomicrobiales bacterium]